MSFFAQARMLSVCYVGRLKSPTLTGKPFSGGKPQPSKRLSIATFSQQHVVLSLRGYPQESPAGRASGSRGTGVQHRGGGCQRNHSYMAGEGPETHEGGRSKGHWSFLNPPTV